MLLKRSCRPVLGQQPGVGCAGDHHARPPLRWLGAHPPFTRKKLDAIALPSILGRAQLRAVLAAAPPSADDTTSCGRPPAESSCPLVSHCGALWIICLGLAWGVLRGCDDVSSWSNKGLNVSFACRPHACRSAGSWCSSCRCRGGCAQMASECLPSSCSLASPASFASSCPECTARYVLLLKHTKRQGIIADPPSVKAHTTVQLHATMKAEYQYQRMLKAAQVPTDDCKRCNCIQRQDNCLQRDVTTIGKLHGLPAGLLQRQTAAHGEGPVHQQPGMRKPYRVCSSKMPAILA